MDVKSKIEAEELKKFKFKVSKTPVFADIDAFRVVHNIKYLYWLEWARTEYFKHIAPKLEPSTYIFDMPFMIVHAEIDYFNPLRFNKEFDIFGRIAQVNNSSLIFENFIITKKNISILFAKANLVLMDFKNYKSMRIPDLLRGLIKDFEGNDVIFKD